MKRILFVLMTIMCLIAASHARAALNPQSPFDVIWDNEPIKIEAGKHFKATITIRVPEEHYIYADKTDVDFASLEGIRIDEIKFPKPETKEDPYLGKTVEIYRGDITIMIRGHTPENFPPGDRELIAVLNFQGCSPKLCLRPEEQEITFHIAVSSSKGGELASRPQEEFKEPSPVVSAYAGGIWSLLKSQDFEAIINRGVVFSILIVFLGGILVSLTPCVWPIIPIILLIIGVEAQKKWWKNIFIAASFVLGLVAINASLGISAVAFGRSLGFLFQNRVFLFIIILFFVAMSLSMFGVFEFHPFRAFHDRLHRLGGKGFRGAFLMGMATGLIASPCASPVLVALLGYVSLKQSYTLGFSLLVIFGLGMGFLFVIIGSAYGMLAGQLKGGRWTIWIKRTLGLILLIPAVFYLRSLVRWNGVFHPGVDSGRPRVEWITSREAGVNFARQENRPIMVEFYADWCPPCRALETTFFKREEIIKLTYQIVPIKIDATVATSDVKKAIANYHVVGWPAFYFLSPDGKLYDDLTVISYDPKKIEASMREAIARAGGRSL